MKLMIDATLQSTGGGVQVAVNLINNLINDDFYEKILLVVSPQVDAQINVPIKKNNSYHVMKNVKGPIKFIQGRELSRLEKEFNPDLVFIVFGPSYWKPKSKSLQGFAIPHLAYSESLNRIYKKSLRQKIKTKLIVELKKKQLKSNIDYMVVETQTFKNLICEKVGFNADKVFVIPNSFNNSFNNKLLIENNDYKKSLVNIFIPSSYYPHKNLDILVDVAKVLKEKYNLNFILNFLLDPKSSHWKNICANAELHGVKQHFFTYGQVSNSEMAKLYEINDLVLLPTLLEVSSAVYPESFISKKPLLTSNLDFAIELCGKAAIYFNPFDYNDMASKINKCAKDKSLQNKLINNGLTQLKKQYLSPQEKYAKQRHLIINLCNTSRKY